jgi:dTDP-4-amino-4,6-dideoxygalactose transaminase
VTSYRIPFNRPLVIGNEGARLADAIASGRLSGNGPFTRQAQQHLERLTGAAAVLLTSSCTHALEMAALLLDLAPGDEVIVPSFTFVSTASAFAMHGARILFADSRPDTLNIDDRLLDTLITPRTRAIVAMHYAGVGCEMDALGALAGRHGVRVIEDNAHGLFGRYRGRALGTFGALATQSFHETKNITCGEGGALLVNETGLLPRAEVIREKGTDRARFFRGEVDKYTWIDVGSNYLPSELQAAFLCAQFEHAAAIQQRRLAIWDRYQSGLADWVLASGARTQLVPPEAEHPAHAYVLVLPTHADQLRLITHLRDQGILAVFHYLPLNTSAAGRRLGGRPGQCPVAEDISERLVRLPMYADLTLEDQQAVIDAVCGVPV